MSLSTITRGCLAAEWLRVTPLHQIPSGYALLYHIMDWTTHSYCSDSRTWALAICSLTYTVCNIIPIDLDMHIGLEYCSWEQNTKMISGRIGKK